jgi:transcriptional regulator GlxA family with amidase domain
VRARKRGGMDGALEESASLLTILAAVLVPAEPETRGTHHRDQARIASTIQWIHAHLAEPLSAETLAAACDLSVSQLTRLFKLHTGLTPMHYVRQARVRHAQELLADVSLSVKQIARRCGFDDPQHFSRVFHQLDGLPPTAYREYLLAGKNGR